MPLTLWKNTPNKTDHSTNGYTSKIIFNFQGTQTETEVSASDDIIKEILNSGKNIKYSGKKNFFPRNYFNNADGRTLRISMYYLKEFDGNDVNLVLQLFNEGTSATFEFFLDAAGPYENVGGYGLVKYECYFSVFYDGNIPTYIAQANGSVMYSLPSGGGSSYNAKMLQMSEYNDIGSIVADEFTIKIINLNGAKISPTSLMIEEIS
jgi:hypothetical protein